MRWLSLSPAHTERKRSRRASTQSTVSRRSSPSGRKNTATAVRSGLAALLLIARTEIPIAPQIDDVAQDRESGRDATAGSCRLDGGGNPPERFRQKHDSHVVAP